MTKIKNWIKDHNIICGVGALFVSLAAVAFGFAYFGMNNEMDTLEIAVDDFDLEVDE
jgi:hypothetical protein